LYSKVEGRIQVRIVGDNYYTRSGNGEPWDTGRGTLVQALVLNGGRAWAPTDGASADPAVLLAAVRRLGSVKFAGKSGSGARALDTYNFRYHIAGDASVKPHRLTGTIAVHDQSDLIATITMQTSVTGAHPQLADGGRFTFKTVMTFSDYGVPVSVRAPAGAGGRSANSTHPRLRRSRQAADRLGGSGRSGKPDITPLCRDPDAGPSAQHGHAHPPRGTTNRRETAKLQWASSASKSRARSDRSSARAGPERHAPVPARTCERQPPGTGRPIRGRVGLAVYHRWRLTWCGSSCSCLARS
jgi:hypothetical protein